MAWQGTPDSKSGSEHSTLAAAVDQDGKPLPAAVDKDGKPLPDAADSKDAVKMDSKKAEPVYVPPRPLKSKYHIQVRHASPMSPHFPLSFWATGEFVHPLPGGKGTE